MKLLGIETSGRSGSIALVENGALIDERELCATGRRHARTLVPEIGALLTTYDWQPRDVDVIAVSIGPGSFTGLRTGLVCAKTFAYAAGCQLVAVDTFLAVASQAPSEVTQLWVIDDALRGDIFAGEYERTETGWRCVTEPMLESLAEWKPAVNDTAVSGPGVAKLAIELEDLNCLPHDVCIPTGAAIALTGEKLARDQQFADIWAITPRYIRRSAAEEKADAT